MRMSHLFSQTLREAPADIEAVGYQLLLRAGFLSPLAPGLFAYLPLGSARWRCSARGRCRRSGRWGDSRLLSRGTASGGSERSRGARSIGGAPGTVSGSGGA
jgi:hypothetical protein